jgi:hypothetical protein
VFERFAEQFKLTSCNHTVDVNNATLKNILSKVRGGIEFFCKFEGSSFNDGLYRVYQIAEIQQWTQIVGNTFPLFKGKIICYAYDWLGRQFALNLNQILDDEPSLLMFDIGTGEILEIATSFQDFHNLIVDHTDEILALNLFTQCKIAIGNTIKSDECIGYKIPLFLNGKEEISNMEITSMKLYWELFGQIFNQVKKLPPGSKVSNIKLQ